MNKPAAFRATYSDLKLIKTRQCVQVIFELPLADFDAAYVILGGMPNPASETWFGIAPLKVSPAAKENVATPETAPDKPTSPAKRHWRELQPAQQAGIRCAEPTFRAFLWAAHSLDSVDEDAASESIRNFCGVGSRSALNDNHKARVIWHQLDSEYQTWLLRERIGA